MLLFTNQNCPWKEMKNPMKPTQEHGRESHTRNTVGSVPLKHQDPAAKRTEGTITSHTGDGHLPHSLFCQGHCISCHEVTISHFCLKTQREAQLTPHPR